jgi:hypothetical protein
MDPFTAVGLASRVLAFITFSTSMVKGAIKIHESLDGIGCYRSCVKYCKS